MSEGSDEAPLVSLHSVESVVFSRSHLHSVSYSTFGKKVRLTVENAFNSPGSLTVLAEMRYWGLRSSCLAHVSATCDSWEATLLLNVSGFVCFCPIPRCTFVSFSIKRLNIWSSFLTRLLDKSPQSCCSIFTFYPALDGIFYLVYISHLYCPRGKIRCATWFASNFSFPQRFLPYSSQLPIPHPQPRQSLFRYLIQQQ